MPQVLNRPLNWLFGFVCCLSASVSCGVEGTASDGTGATGGTSGKGSGGGTATGGAGNGKCSAALLIDDLENEERATGWYTLNDGSTGAKQTPASGTFRAEQAPGGSLAAHTSGDGYTTWGAGIGFRLQGVEGCIDFGKATGIRFRAKGPAHLSIAAKVPGVIPVAEGGTCKDEPKCYDSHKTSVTVADGWQNFEFHWSSFSQSGWGEKVDFHPNELVAIEFSVVEMPFDFWIDDLGVIEGAQPGTGGSTGTGGSPGSGGSGGGTVGTGGAAPVGAPFSDVVSESQFNSFFPERGPFYTFKGLVDAAKKYPRFVNEGDMTVRKREAAAFLANLSHESGALRFIVEQNTSNYCHYCDPSKPYGCPAGECEYYGRGPIQLSWNYNYDAAGKALGRDLLNNPGLVASDPQVAWETGVWFWNVRGVHAAMVANKGFGETIRIINGGNECGTPKPGFENKVDERIRLYRRICEILGIDPGDKLDCRT